jgi:hypothetical protein
MDFFEEPAERVAGMHAIHYPVSPSPLPAPKLEGAAS